MVRMIFTINNRTHVCILTIFANIWISKKLKISQTILQKSVQKTWRSKFWHIQFGPRGSFCTYNLFPRLFQKLFRVYWQKVQIFHFFNFWKTNHRSLKKVCEKVLKIRKGKTLFVSFVHAGLHGRLFFYPSQLHIGPIWLLKLPILFCFLKLKSLKLICKNPWVKQQKINILLHTIWRQVQECHFAPMTQSHGHSKSRLIVWSILIRKW